MISYSKMENFSFQPIIPLLCKLGPKIFQIGIPIQSITPLWSSKGNPIAEVVFIEYLMPTSVEEMPLSNIFFNKKRNIVVKREVHQREGVPVKRHRVLYDG